ncbi:LURP-one-related/scramblase family protein [Thalassotalea aquiviva]|uniref:LURP-one-related/scramblase family protein n=1 Tax=Thalassotalea aquiviva TaxID=3242415 RepID=UPI00352A2BEA
MARYQLKQRFLSLNECFEISNEQNEVVYTLQGKFFSLGKQFTLTNLVNGHQIKIQQKLLSFRPTFVVSQVDENDPNAVIGQQTRIIKTFFPLLKTRFLIQSNGKELQVMGSFFSHEYEFFIRHSDHSREVIARVSKQWFSVSDTYGVDIYQSQYTPWILSYVIVIDAIHHENGKG